MVLTRFLHLQIWDANNEYIKYDNKTSTNWGITAGTVKLDKILMTDQLNFGEINSSALELQVFGIDEDLSNRKIKLEALDAVVEEKYLVDDDMNRIVTDLGDYIIVDNLNPEHIFPLFCGYIESAEKDYISTDRNIKAYDWLYFHKNDNIAQWWNIWWIQHNSNLTNSISVETFMSALLTQMGLTTDSDLVHSNIPNLSSIITNPFTYTTTSGQSTGTSYFATEIKFGDILSMLCKLMNTTALIDGDFTNIHFFRLQDAETYDLTDNLEKEECKWEDFETDTVTGVGVYDTSNSLAQTVGTTDNLYNVAGNVFILNQSASDVENIATAILDDIENIQYVPCTLKCIVSDLNHRLGDIVHTEKGNSYILGIYYSGPLLVEEEIICPASNGRALSEKVDSYNDSIIEGVKSAVFEKDIDHFKSEFRNTTEGLSSAIEQNTSKISAEVSRAQSQEEISGVVNQVEVMMDPVYDPDTGEMLQNGVVILKTNIVITRKLAEKMKFGVWVKGIPVQYETYDKYLYYEEQLQTFLPPIQGELLPIYYTGTERLTNQYKNGVILHIMYLRNQQFTVGGQTQTLSGWWVGADDSLARLEITAEGIKSYVGNNFVSQTAYDAEIARLQSEIDNQIETFTGSVEPTLSNYPASSWTTDADKDLHIGDLYIVDEDGGALAGKYYRFNKTNNVYSWTQLADTDVTKALQEAEEANQRAKAAQQQLDEFTETTTGNFTQVNQTISGVTTTVSGIQKREVKNNTFSATTESYSTDGIVYKLNTALSDVDTDTRLAILLQSIPWDTTEAAKKRYIKIDDETTEIGVNTFPVYYSKDTPLTNQLGLGNVLNVKFYSNYNTTGSTTESAFVVSNNDRTYERLESELSVERGRIVLRAENTSPVSGGGYKGRLAIARLDSTGSSSELYLSADNIKLEAGDGMKLLAGQTLTLSGANGLVIDSPNFNVYRDGKVVVHGDIEATSLTLVDGETIDAVDISGLAPVATSGNYNNLNNLPDLDIIDENGNISGGTYSSGQTGVRISKGGLLQASNAVIYGTIYASAGSFTGTVVANSLKFNNTLQSINPYHNNETYNLITHFGGAESYGSRINTESGYEAIRLIGYDAGDFNGYRGILKGKWWLENAVVSDLTKNGTWGDSNRASLDTALMNTLYASYGKGTATLNNLWCFGFITSSGTQLSVVVPISLRYSVTSITATSATIALRTAKGGYVVSSGASIGNPTASVMRGQNMIYLASIRSGGWYDSDGNKIPNNSTVIGQISFTANFS